MSLSFILENINSAATLYLPYLPAFLLSFIVSIILTPLIGKFALRIKALDLPAHMRGRGERNLETRINPDIHPKLGGLVITVCIFLVTLLIIKSISPGIAAGVTIITLYGFLDDKFDLGFRWQILGQLLAAIATVAFGANLIDQASFLGIQFDGKAILLQLPFLIITAGQIVTILWIVSLINFINWVGGVDGLNNAVSAIAGILILVIGVATGSNEFTILALVATHVGANLGNLIYIYPPAKLFTGTIGEHLNGYLLAVFALTVGAKSPVALVVLGLPLLDAVVVMFNRVFKALRSRQGLIKALSSATNGDRTHLHHRLLDAGFSEKGVLGIETSITLILGAISLYIWNITNNWAVVVLIGLSLLIIMIVLIITISNRQKSKRVLTDRQNPKASVVILNEEPAKKEDEQKFVY